VFHLVFHLVFYLLFHTIFFFSGWTNPVNIMVDLKTPGLMKITNRIIYRMLTEGYVMLTIRGNFTFNSGGLQFAPKNYEQL